MPPYPAEVFGQMLPAFSRGAAWTVNWLATYAIHSTLLIGLVWLVCRAPLGRRLSPAQQAMLWRLALAGGIVTATLQSVMPVSPLGGTMQLASRLSPEPLIGVLVSRSTDISGVTEVATRFVVRPVWPMIAVLLWVTAVGTGLTLLFVAKGRFARRLAWRENSAAVVAENALRELQRRVGRPRPLTLRTTRALQSPVALGTDEIYLPERALTEFDLHHLESMLAHELAHLERRDATWLLAARLIEVLLFFQPLNRVARRRMVEAAELAADAWAVGVTSRPVTLARCLARVAEWTSAERMTLAPAMVERRSSALVDRVRRLTNSRPADDGMPARGLWMVMAGILVLAGVLAPRAVVGGSHNALAGSRQRVEFRVHEADARLPGRLFTDKETFVVRVRRPL